MWCSGVALVAFVVLVVFPKTDVGITAVAMAVILQILFRPNEKALLARIPWNSILLLCGLLTYLGLLEQIGTIASIQKGLNHLGTGPLLILVVAYMTALLCNIESSTLGVLGLIAPLVFAAFGNSGETFWVIAAVFRSRHPRGDEPDPRRGHLDHRQQRGEGSRSAVSPTTRDCRDAGHRRAGSGVPRAHRGRMTLGGRRTLQDSCMAVSYPTGSVRRQGEGRPPRAPITTGDDPYCST